MPGQRLMSISVTTVKYGLTLSLLALHFATQVLFLCSMPNPIPPRDIAPHEPDALIAGVVSNTSILQYACGALTHVTNCMPELGAGEDSQGPRAKRMFL